ncbi:MAG: hypothetical protein ACRD1O_03680, partial [Terriglobia bacterium]
MKHHDLAHLERQINDLRSSLTRLADDRDLQELLKHIHQPGWTTPAEYTMVTGIVDSMLVHTEALGGLKRAVINGSRAVTASTELNPQPLPP